MLLKAAGAKLTAVATLGSTLTAAVGRWELRCKLPTTPVYTKIKIRAITTIYAESHYKELAQTKVRVRD
jgi:hypothetical protein